MEIEPTVRAIRILSVVIYSAAAAVKLALLVFVF